ncbi:uncharacterized protein K460DRAFT_401593 [Cucurbitaria berberidis CBS 394.84]|uniref:Uncharacterized protein n=1 Tax=Cucurbitaria berberidis CBS 394.84 TaxID=1168544 RepID=A0A9P4GS77_9PLEO|nr:uncharacterized protein K460DRAFT_401593 [Cucurbitaria berberidis CBS 394.84]KAF1851578.1 hypothetical protein K460DRAFT_401593 [Cucurbitaria berberidis CBS 394.84]
MHAFSLLITLGSMLASAMAAPAPIEDTLETTSIPLEDTLETDFVTLAARDNIAVVTAYNGDTCNGGNSQFTVVGGGNRCVPFSNVRSISVSGNGCVVRTWSGNNCAGSSAGPAYGRCTSVLFASVSVTC